MYLKLKNIRLLETKFGYDIVIKQVELRDGDGNFVKHPKLDAEMAKVLHNVKIELNDR